MESQRIVDYIREQRKAGHTEAALRLHLGDYGWSQSAINKAFSNVNSKHNLAEVNPILRRGGKQKKTWWTRQRITASMMGIGLVVMGLMVTFHLLLRPKAVVVLPVASVSYQTKQTIDVNTIGGAVGQYVAANGGILPTRLSVSGDNSLVLCNVNCDPATSEIASLQTYNAVGVKLLSYAPALAVPDQNTMYLVSQAKCASTSKLGSPNSNTRSMIILYAQLIGKELSQHCVTL